MWLTGHGASLLEAHREQRMQDKLSTEFTRLYSDYSYFFQFLYINRLKIGHQKAISAFLRTGSDRTMRP
jgi:hypothetical protein